MNMLNLPKKVYFKRGSMSVALKEFDEVYNCKRAFIISDANLYRLGVVDPVDEFMRGRGIRTAEFFTFDSVPTFENVLSGLPKMLEYQPDVIIGIGGGSVMSAAKVMWLLYENPEIDLNDIADKFNTTDASYADFPDVGNKAKLALVTTNASTGAECSPFAVLADGSGKKRVIASYKLIPEMAVIDAMFTDSMSASLLKKSGINALSQAVRAYIAKGSCEYTQGFAREAVEIVLTKLQHAMQGCPAGCERLTYAAALAGMAFSNAADTIDTDAGVYPQSGEKSAKNLGKEELASIIDLAKHVGIEGDSDDKIFDNWISACEKLNTL